MKRVAPLFLLGLLLTACRTVPRTTDATAGYRAAVAEFAGRPTVTPGSDAERRGLDNLQRLLGSFTPENVRSLTTSVYAPDAYFNDTLKTIRGATNIQSYLLATAENAESVTAQFEDVTRSADGTYYLRWVMETRLKKIARGETIRTPGITHVRFDDQGRVLIHQDYWDSATGLWDHVPVLGRMTRAIKARL